MIILLSNSVSTVFASSASLNFGDWIDTSYYQRAYDHTGWSSLRIEAFDNAKRVITKYNLYTKFNTNKGGNMVVLINELQSDELNKNSKSNRETGKELEEYWEDIGNYLLTIDSMTHTYCATGSGIPVLDDRNTEVQNSDYTDLISKCRDIDETMNLAVKTIRQAYQQAHFQTGESIITFTDSVYSIGVKLWNQLGSFLGTMGTGSLNTNNLLGISWTTGSMKQIAVAVSGITKTFAYGIAIVLFGLNLTNTALQFDITSIRGFIKVFAGFIIGKLWIDLSIEICASILNIVNSLNRQLISTLFNGTTPLQFKSTFTTNSSAENDWWDYFGVIINYFEQFLWHLPECILSFCVCICIFLVYIKLVTRNFELTALMCLAPLAFATTVSDETKVYFKKFIGAFISTALYATYMVICYAVGSQWLSEITANQGENTSFVNTIMSIIPRFMIIAGICKVMRKPPKVLTSLID